MAAKELKDLGERVEVIAYHNKIGYAEMIRDNDIPIRVVGDRAMKRLGRAFALASYLRENRFDVVHGFKDNAAFYTRFAACLNKGPAYFCGFRGLAPNRPWQSRLHALPIARPAGWIVNSKAVKVSVEKLIGVRPERVHVVPNGLDPVEWECGLTEAQAKARLNINPDQRVVSMVAQIRPVKNYPLFLKMAQSIIRVEKNVVFLVIGDGPDLPDLKQMARELGVASSVFWLGERDDIPELLRASDLSVLTSDNEGLPNALIEAAVSGVPCVATDHGGSSDVIVEGKTGFLVPPGTVEAMSERLILLLGDTERRARMGKAARKRALAIFSSKAMGRRMLDVYREGLVT